MNIKEEITIEIATKELYNKAIERLKEKMLDESEVEHGNPASNYHNPG